MCFRRTTTVGRVSHARDITRPRNVRDTTPRKRVDNLEKKITKLFCLSTRFGRKNDLDPSKRIFYFWYFKNKIGFTLHRNSRAKRKRNKIHQFRSIAMHGTHGYHRLYGAVKIIFYFNYRQAENCVYVISAFSTNVYKIDIFEVFLCVHIYRLSYVDRISQIKIYIKIHTIIT